MGLNFRIRMEVASGDFGGKKVYRRLDCNSGLWTVKELTKKYPVSKVWRNGEPSKIEI